MIKKSHRKLVLFLKLVILIVVLLISIVNLKDTISSSINENGNLTFINQAPEQGYILKNFAYISGAVNNPGVYEVKNDTRLVELIELAGGLTLDADVDYLNKNLNLSTIVQDSQHILIPVKKPQDGLGSSSDSSKININTATASELDSLPGIGASTATKIINARPFSSIEDIKNVSGIGDSKFAQIKDLITVQ